MNLKIIQMTDNNNGSNYLINRPKVFDPHDILLFLDIMDKKSIEAEIAFDEVKDQKEEMFDYVVNEKVTNESIATGLAKVKANKDERYRKVKKLLSDRKKAYLFAKVEAKNAHTYCDLLKQKSINELAIEKLTKH